MIKNKFDKNALLNETKIIKSVICGANIKPISINDKTIKIFGNKVFGKETKWGVFIHCKVDDNKQIDLIFSLTDSFRSHETDLMFNCTPVSKVKLRKRKKKETVFISPRIPIILEACNANEWVELIGKELLIISSNDDNGYAIGIVKDGDIVSYFRPQYYEIQ